MNHTRPVFSSVKSDSFSSRDSRIKIYCSGYVWPKYSVPVGLYIDIITQGEVMGGIAK